MKLDEALEHLDAISAAAHRTNTFDGLRSFPTGLTSLIALAAALVQNRLTSHSPHPVAIFLTLWIGVAGLALTIVLADMTLRYYRDRTARNRRLTLGVLSRLSPAICVGAGLTAIIYFTAGESAWMLPGLWSVLLGLGIYAASTLLPQSLQLVGLWYVACGLAVLMLGQGPSELHPMTMAVPFGVGQCLAAFLMHRSHAISHRSTN